MARYGDIEAQSRHDFGAHQRNGAESEAGGEPKKKGVALVPYSLFLDRFEPRLEALVELRGVEPLSKHLSRPLSTYLSDVRSP